MEGVLWKKILKFLDARGEKWVVEIEEVISLFCDIHAAKFTVFSPGEILLSHFFKGGQGRCDGAVSITQARSCDLNADEIHVRLETALGYEVEGNGAG